MKSSDVGKVGCGGKYAKNLYVEGIFLVATDELLLIENILFAILTV